MTDLYDIVVEGKTIAGFEDQEVKENLANIFKEPPEKMERLLAGKSVIVQRKVNHERAIKIIGMLKKAGVECKIVKQKSAAAKPLTMEKSNKSDLKSKRSKKSKSDKVSDRAAKPQQSSQTNPYKTPKANLLKNKENNSGQGKGIVIPDGVKGWSWGAFLLNWIWAIGNKTWIGLFALIPYVGFIFAIVLGIKGREWAWQKKQWDSFEHFQRVQKKWSFWGVIIIAFFVGIAIIGIIAAIVLPIFLANK